MMGAKMARFTRVLIIVLLVLAPARAFAGPTEDASAVIDRWAATYNANDVDAIVKLYTPDALLHGTSSPTLNEGSAAIRGYFAGIAGSGNKVTIGERHMVALGDAAAFGVGFYEFVAIQNGKPVPRPARFTMIVVKRGADWLIVHHHSSALPPPRQ
jgi:uncharacterized protein (TIGR02246 family)